jgi:hypothetical protein
MVVYALHGCRLEQARGLARGQCRTLQVFPSKLARWPSEVPQERPREFLQKVKQSSQAQQIFPNLYGPAHQPFQAAHPLAVHPPGGAHPPAVQLPQAQRRYLLDPSRHPCWCMQSRCSFCPRCHRAALPVASKSARRFWKTCKSTYDRVSAMSIPSGVHVSARACAVWCSCTSLLESDHDSERRTLVAPRCAL